MKAAIFKGTGRTVDACAAMDERRSIEAPINVNERLEESR